MQVVSGLRSGSGRAFGNQIAVSGVAGDVGRVVRVHWKEGSPAVPRELGAVVSAVRRADLERNPVGTRELR